jgi:predicted dehydrogenase
MGGSEEWSSRREPLRVGLVGLGRIARAHVDALKGREDVQLIGGVEPNLAVADAWEREGLPTYNETTSLVEFGRPDAVIVCSPPDVHHANVRALLLAGVHVLAEKPLARTAAEAQVLVAKAAEKGRVLQTASKFGVMPALARAAELVRAGAVGTPLRVENVFAGVLDVRSDWRAEPRRSGGGVWMDNGPHSLDVLTAVFGAPEKIRVVALEHRQGTAVEDEVAVELGFAGGVEGAIRLTWNEAVRAPIARVEGAAGTLDVGWADLRVRRGAEEDVEPGGYDKVACFRAVHDRFFAAIWKSAGAGAAGAEDHGARALAAIEAGYRSAAAGGEWQALVPTERPAIVAA